MGNHKAHYFKCHNSDGNYTLLNVERMTYEQRWIYDHKCENDSKSYQACSTIPNQLFKSFDGAICRIKIIISDKSSEVIGEMIKFDPDPYSEKRILPSGQITNNKALCNGRCDLEDCEDEAQCNGFVYGYYCHLYGNDSKPMIYIRPGHICYSYRHIYKCCRSTGTEKNQKLCKAEKMCTNTVAKCRSVVNNYWPFNQVIMDHLLNITRCFPKIMCDPPLDQTNCTDQNRVGATCKIDGYQSTVSKYAVCGKSPLCDDSLDSLCETVSQCTVHKHQLCDTIEDCMHRADERLSICHSMTKEKCTRRGGSRISSLPIPLAWLKDNIKDCIDGEDENWPFCGLGRTKRFVHDHATCSNVYMCRTGRPGWVEFESLCDGIETCGNENGVCRASRASKTSMSRVRVVSYYYSQGLQRNLTYCLRGLEELEKLTKSCFSRNFMYPPGDMIFGLEEPLLTLPNTTTKCDGMFGEQYVYTSCAGKCLDSPCPLNNILLHDSCPEYYTNRVRTIVNNEYLTFAVKAKSEKDVYVNDIFLCDNGYKCISYYEVCDLVNDCDDGSDENNCTNNFKCNSTGHFIPKTSKCDRKIDCLDLSDECNDKCSKEILSGLILETFSWTIGLIAVLANTLTISVGFFSIKKCRTTVALTNKLLIILIAVGDLLVGAYLLIVSVFNTAHGKDYCTDQLAWLASDKCSILGVTSTIGSQLSLFSMTILSLIRVHGIWNSMSIPGEVTIRSSMKVIAASIVLLALAITMAVLPIIRVFDDFFVNGIVYDSALKIFIGLVDKETHLRIFEEYFGRLKNSVLSWESINELVADMFSHDEGIIDFTKTHSKVGFYGNDGVCLFKYFITQSDPQKVFVWGTLMVNFFCFILISVCYVLIAILSMRSSRNVSAGRDDQAKRRTRRMNQKISIIITTDFICWMPFIIICVLHYLEFLDATPWYSFFSMIILPINSVINPLLYTDTIGKYAKKFSTRLSISISSVISSMRSKRSKAHDVSTENTPQENIEMQDIN